MRGRVWSKFLCHSMLEFDWRGLDPTAVGGSQGGLSSCTGSWLKVLWVFMWLRDFTAFSVAFQVLFLPSFHALDYGSWALHAMFLHQVSR